MSSSHMKSHRTPTRGHEPEVTRTCQGRFIKRQSSIVHVILTLPLTFIFLDYDAITLKPLLIPEVNETLSDHESLI